MMSTTFFLSFAIMFLFCSFISSANEGGKYEFSYNMKAPWGPQHWGELNKEWAQCGHGMMQSPIDLRNQYVYFDTNMGRLHTHYVKSHAILNNHGHDVQLAWPKGGGWTMIEGTKYTLMQLHWHTPTEHTINGQRFDMEMHMVHKNANNSKLAVVGVLFQLGPNPDPLLSELKEPLQYLKRTGKKSVRVGKRMAWPLQTITSYFRYFGSLTTPPCSEGIIWTIMDEIMSVTPEQLNLLQGVVKDEFHYNARPLQSLNGRCIHLYLPQP